MGESNGGDLVWLARSVWRYHSGSVGQSPRLLWQRRPSELGTEGGELGADDWTVSSSDQSKVNTEECLRVLGRHEASDMTEPVGSQGTAETCRALNPLCIVRLVPQVVAMFWAVNCDRNCHRWDWLGLRRPPVRVPAPSSPTGNRNPSPSGAGLPPAGWNNLRRLATMGSRKRSCANHGRRKFCWASASLLSGGASALSSSVRLVVGTRVRIPKGVLCSWIRLRAAGI